MLLRHLGATDSERPAEPSTTLTSSPTQAVSPGTIVLSPEVRHAIADGRAVVALESTIVSHGMPYPQNLETAREVEAIVRRNGATPATIAIIGGVPHVGLTDAQLVHIARAGSAVRKASRRDLPHLKALGLDGATTVSATMLLAARAGVSIFVTGGAMVSTQHEAPLPVIAPAPSKSHAPFLTACRNSFFFQALEGFTGVVSRPWTCLRISPSSVALQWLSSAPAPSRCWTFLEH